MFNSTLVIVFLLMKFPGWQCDTKFLGWHQILGWHRDANAWIRWQNSQNDSVTANFGVKPMLELGDKTAKIWLPNLSQKLCHQHISVSKVTKWPLKNDVVFFRPRDGVFLLHLNFYFESSIASMLIIGIQSQPQIAELIKWWRHVLKTREIIWIIHYYEMTNWWNYFTAVIILTVFQINDFHMFSDWLTLICFDMIGCNGVSRIHKPSFCIQYCM